MAGVPDYLHMRDTRVSVVCMRLSVGRTCVLCHRSAGSRRDWFHTQKPTGGARIREPYHIGTVCLDRMCGTGERDSVVGA